MHDMHVTKSNRKHMESISSLHSNTHPIRRRERIHNRSEMGENAMNSIDSHGIHLVAMFAKLFGVPITAHHFIKDLQSIRILKQNRWKDEANIITVMREQ